MDFLIRLVQVHESFRRAEIEALAAISGVSVDFVSYSSDVRYQVPFTPGRICSTWMGERESAGHLLGGMPSIIQADLSPFSRRFVNRSTPLYPLNPF